MRGHWRLHVLAFCAVVARLGCSAVPFRDYVSGSWSKRFYRPRDVQIEAVGIVNEKIAFFATKRGISTFHDGLLTNVIEVANAEITAFHLCHHRYSILYEEASLEGGVLSIFEYSLSTRHKMKVAEFQDTTPATSLACVDQLLLRTSRANLLAVNLRNSVVNILRKFQIPESSDAILSLAVGYAADVYTAAQIYAIEAGNRTVLRLHLTSDGDQLQVHSEPLLVGGDGNDGPLSTATVHDPQHVLWSHDKIIFVDGCSLRQLHDGHVRTLLGVPTRCIEPGNETLEPVPWASLLSRPLGLASTAEGTAVGTVLALTSAGVMYMVHHDDVCVGHHTAANCVGQNDCGWAEDPKLDQRLCFACDRLTQWADGERPVVDSCSLEAAPRGGTTYALTGCGCVAPTPDPQPPPPSPGAEDVETGGMIAVHTILAFMVTIATFVVVILLYRKHRRATVMHELYGTNTAEFHTFTDDAYFH